MKILGPKIVAFVLWLWCLILPQISLYAQSGEKIRELERLALFGSKQELQDSLALVYQASQVDSMALARVGAILACRDGRVEDARRWYEGLSSRERRQFENQLLGTLLYLNNYELDKAAQALKQLRNIRLKDKESQMLRDAIDRHYGEVERLLGNTRAVEVWNVVSGSMEEIFERLQSATPFLGKITRDTYTSPNGQTKWRIAKGEKGWPVFLVVHQLGDGSWDEDNAETVEVRGLPEGAELSYPWLMSDGNTLYFVIEEMGILPSRGLGGKDIYVSRFDREARALLVPQLLPMPFNSPADDLIYMTDEANDVGWLVTGRGLNSGEVKLYTFKPSSVKRYEEDHVEDVALWQQPVMIEGERRMAKEYHALPVRSDKKVYFWIYQQPISSESDLKTSEAKNLFHQFVSTATALEQLEERLEGLRQQVSEHPQEVSRWRDELLNMEERVEVLRAQVGALRNEVIRAEQELNK